MQFQFNTDHTVMGTENVAERIEAMMRTKFARFEDRLTRIEVHVSGENGHKHGHDDKACTIEARPRGGRPIGVTEHGSKVDAVARKAAATMEYVLVKASGLKSRPSCASRVKTGTNDTVITSNA